MVDVAVVDAVAIVVAVAAVEAVAEVVLDECVRELELDLRLCGRFKISFSMNEIGKPNKKIAISRT